MSLEPGTVERYPDVTAELQRRAAIRIADHIAAQHPHEYDAVIPKHRGRLLGQAPAIAAGLRELLAALGIEADQIARRRNEQ